MLRFSRTADDSVSRASLVEGWSTRRPGQGKKDHVDRIREKRHRHDGGLETDRRQRDASLHHKEHDVALVVALVDRDDGGCHIRHDDAQAAGDLADDVDRDDVDDDDDLLVDIIDSEPLRIPRPAERSLESRLHRDFAANNLAHASAHRGHGVVIEKISSLRRGRCHDHRASNVGQGDARVARQD